MLILRVAAIVRIEVQALQRFFSTFPSGPPAIGLLVLRCAAGTLAVAQGVASLHPAVPIGDMSLAVIETSAGTLLLAGFLTPLVSGALALAHLSAALSWMAYPAEAHFEPHFLFVAAVELGISILGPGALSVDARLFGRHRIVIPPPR